MSRGAPCSSSWRRRWHRFWLALPMLLPDRLWLQRVEKQPARLRLEGQAQDMKAIRDFRQRLAG
ncbi:PilN domain-containing protein [Candidatus Pantoea persica]|uniref:PilN domain-containing protein n=1 Tax=Candidatus Pantoea persica TaxID=2518128 RepID=UPI00215DA769|nr:PilN domain-containing protein [Candidatus Pantoea persica]